MHRRLTADAPCQVVTSNDGGVPDFWLQVLKNNMITSEEVQQADEPVLKSLVDIKCSSNLGGGKKGFQLAFVFAPNDYFEDSMLTKTCVRLRAAGAAG